MTTIAVDLPPETLDRFADMVAERVLGRLRRSWNQSDDGWLNSKDAAAYLGITANALHKLTSARTLPFSQERPGGACYFQRADLDAYRRTFMLGR